MPLFVFFEKKAGGCHCLLLKKKAGAAIACFFEKKVGGCHCLRVLFKKNAGAAIACFV